VFQTLKPQRFALHLLERRQINKKKEIYVSFLIVVSLKQLTTIQRAYHTLHILAYIDKQHLIQWLMVHEHLNYLGHTLQKCNSTPTV